MKKYLLPFVLLALVLCMGSCGSIKKIPYFTNIDTLNLASSRGLYDAKIMPKDQLTITVVTSDPAAAQPFNLSHGTSGGSGESSTGTANNVSYLVNNDGCIDFPVVGTLHVVGLTKDECQNLIKEKISPYLAATENPVVIVRMSGYRVTVAGEVGSPTVVPVTSEKMSILEALAQAGDLTVYGRRDNVLLIREDASGQKSQHRLNLNDANLINSPYYYLQQNDYVYVEPNKVKSRNSTIGSSTTLWFSFVGIVTSVASLIVNILR